MEPDLQTNWEALREGDAMNFVYRPEVRLETTGRMLVRSVIYGKCLMIYLGVEYDGTVAVFYGRIQ